MTFVITDRSLEDFQGFTVTKNMRLSEGGSIDRDCVSLCRVSMEHLRRYTHGFDNIDDLLNHTLNTDTIEWNVYVTAKHRSNETSIMLLFVFEYLKDGGHIVLYDQDGVVQFHPETPVSTIDVSLKREGHTPLDHAWLKKDVMYHFHRSRPYAFKHDTKLLMRMGMDETYPEPGNKGGFMVTSPITVGELMSIAGNSIGMFSIHDYEKTVEVMDLRLNAPDIDYWTFHMDFQPIKLIMTGDAKLYALENEYKGPIVDHLKSYDDEVVMYVFYSAGSHCPDYFCFGSDTPIPPDMFAIAAFIRTH